MIGEQIVNNSSVSPQIEIFGNQVYVAYRNTNTSLTVKTLNLGDVTPTWADLGVISLSNGGSPYSSFKMALSANGTPSIAWADSNNYTLNIVKYDSDANDGVGAWDLPTEVFNFGGWNGQAKQIDLKFNGETPYVVFLKNSWEGAFVYTTTEEGSWEILGSTIELGNAASLDLEFDNTGTPYMISSDWQGVVVVKYNSDTSAWNELDPTNSSSALANTKVDLQFDSNNKPFLVGHDSNGEMVYMEFGPVPESSDNGGGSNGDEDNGDNDNNEDNGGGATPPPPSNGGGSSTPVAPTSPVTPAPTAPIVSTVDGTTVQTTTTTQTRTTTDASGNKTTATVSAEKFTILPVSTTRTDSTGGATTADVPLFWGESSRTEWATTASIPVGIGLSTEGSRAPAEVQTKQTALADLIFYIDNTTPNTDNGKSKMLSGGTTFLGALSNIETLVVNKVTLTSTDIAASVTPITITGTANTIVTTAGDIAPVEALVIDAHTLPFNSTLQLQNVEFAVIIGEDLTIRGGEGKNILFTGAGHQNIMLGEDDDELYAGDGDDTVGSAGGDDRIFGEAGNDTIFGGEGNDMLHGGSGTDVATYSGNIAEYIITRDEGKTYVALASNPNEIDTIINTETIKFADGNYTIENSIMLNKIATLYTQILGRQAEIDGFQYWAKDTISLGNIALGFIESAEYKSSSGVNWETLDASAKVEQFYEALLGRSSDEGGKAYWVNAINTGMTFEQAAEGFIESIEMQGIYQAKEDWNFFV
ncbi:DUF4214 domain-containing protein [Sulfurimonas denitrificans]|nr:DUF4214 domain-containing protein [Sulfurimonas denitrificans]